MHATRPHWNRSDTGAYGVYVSAVTITEGGCILPFRACTLAILALALFVANPAFAQTVPQTQGGANSGVGDKADKPKDVDKGQNMILPSAGSSGQSAAPTMVYDCQAKPQDCTVPATPADKNAAPDPNAAKQPIKP